MLLTWIEGISQAANGEMCDVVARRTLLHKSHRILQLTGKCILSKHIRKLHVFKLRQPSYPASLTAMCKVAFGQYVERTYRNTSKVLIAIFRKYV